MKIVVIGGSGLIGAKTVAILRAKGHEAIAASPRNGVDSVTGAGLNEALRGAQVVIDVSNAPSWAPDDVMAFFRTSTTNLVKTEVAAGVQHHVALSVVGTDRMPDNGYFRAKVAQEQLIAESGVPYSIIRATQFMEFLGGIADAGTQDGRVHLRQDSSSRSRRMTSRPSSPMSRSPRRRTASSISRGRSVRRCIGSSASI
jgi:uncharacterized protein YbjT (DUF2867 family)